MITVALFFHRISSAGGAERMICWLANVLQISGFQVVLFSQDSEADDKSFYKLNKEIIWIRINSSHNQIKRTVQIFRELRRYRVSVFIGFVVSGDRAIYAATMLARVKLIIAERNAPSMYRLRFTITQRLMCFGLMHLSDRITVQSNRFVQGYPTTLQKKIVCIPNPVKLPTPSVSPGTENGNGRFELLAVSRFDSRQKGIECLIEAFSLIEKDFPCWNLRLVGDGPQKRDVKKLIVKHHLQDRVYIEPATHSVSQYYKQAHLFVMPSLWEGFPNALAEAMSYGLPVIGFSQADGVADLISTKSGWLARGLGDPKSLSISLREAMSDRYSRERKGKEARCEMTQYTPRVQEELWINLIKETVKDLSFE